jgi:hypothetical protein
MSKAIITLYRIVLLASLIAIALYAKLIYERMPITFGEFEKAKASKLSKDFVQSRIPMMRIVGGEVSVSNELDVNVTNTELDVNVTNDPLNVNVTNDPLDVNVTNDPLDVAIQRR